MIKRIANTDSKEERKVLCSSLSKLHFPVTASLDQLNELKDWLTELIDADIVTETVPKNALKRFSSTLDKAIAKVSGASTTVLNDITATSDDQTEVPESQQTQQGEQEDEGEAEREADENEEEETETVRTSFSSVQ
jgi:cobalamin biosynthesis protein CobT